MSTDEPLGGSTSPRHEPDDARGTRPSPVPGDTGADGFISSLQGGRYQLVERVGAGAIGQVWRAQDTNLEREVAIKTINLATSADPSTEARFRREAVATAGLNHPNIVQIYDSGVDGHSAYIVMEFLHGPNLQSVVTKQGPIDWRTAVPVLAQVAAGLGAAHRLGIVHRDVKPANVVLMTDELTSTPKLVDFGIARLGGQQSTALTSTMTAIGSAAYMSPEQAAGERVDPNSDMYSFGCLIMTVLTGQPPFPGESPVAVARAQVYDTPPLLRTRLPEAPASLENLVAALLSKQPQARPSAGEVVAALNAIHGDPDAPGLIEPPAGPGPAAEAATMAISSPNSPVSTQAASAATGGATGQGLTRIMPGDAAATGASSTAVDGIPTASVTGTGATAIGAAGSTGGAGATGPAPIWTTGAPAAGATGSQEAEAATTGRAAKVRKRRRIIIAILILAVLITLIIMAWAHGQKSVDPPVTPSSTVTETQTQTATAPSTTAAPTTAAQPTYYETDDEDTTYYPQQTNTWGGYYPTSEESYYNPTNGGGTTTTEPTSVAPNNEQQGENPKIQSKRWKNWENWDDGGDDDSSGN